MTQERGVSETSPEGPSEAYTGVTTPAEGCGSLSASAGPVSGAVPDVRLIPAGSVGGWPNDVVAIRRDHGLWRCTNSAWLSDAEVEEHGQRLFPARSIVKTLGLLDYLLDQYQRVVSVHERIVMDTEEDRELHQRSVDFARQAARPAQEWVDSFPPGVLDHIRAQVRGAPDSHTRQEDQ